MKALIYIIFKYVYIVLTLSPPVNDSFLLDLVHFQNNKNFVIFKLDFIPGEGGFIPIYNKLSYLEKKDCSVIKVLPWDLKTRLHFLSLLQIFCELRLVTDAQIFKCI